MCNINIYVKKNKLEGLELNKLMAFITSTTAKSYTTNDDGEGFYFDNGTLHKSLYKLNPLDYVNDINSSNMILTHQRIATSGKSEEYLHPFDSEEFVLMHNGVLSDFVMNENDHSDTFNMFQKFIKDFGLSKNPERKGKIVETIRGIFDKLSGSYSVAIYDKTTKVIYYFKNDRTSMYFYINANKDFFYMTTSKDNEKLLCLLDGKFYEKEVEDYKIYEILLEDVIRVRKVGKIKEAETKVYYSSGLGGYGYSGMTSYENYSRSCVVPDTVGDVRKTETVEEIIKDKGESEVAEAMDILGLDFVENESEGFCAYCGKVTNICACDLDIMVCKDCLKNEFDMVYHEIQSYRGDDYYDIVKPNKTEKLTKDELEEIKDYNRSFEH
jgi:predicted glutamine amidotransferase